MRRKATKRVIMSRRGVLKGSVAAVSATAAIAIGETSIPAFGLGGYSNNGTDGGAMTSTGVQRAITAASAASLDRLIIAELVAKWALWRDAGDWDRFRTVWHDDGVMEATWTQGTVDDFIEANKKGWNEGVSILHFLGGTAVDVVGDRAIAETKMTISQRGKVEGVECDVVCTGRFYDFFQQRRGRWGMVYRQPIYEKDRLDPVDPAAVPTLDNAKLASYPCGYRHLAYLQAGLGYPIKKNMPGLKGEAVEMLYDKGRDWLEGKPLRF